MNLYLKLSQEDGDLLTKLTNDFNRKHNLALSRQAFVLKLINDEAERIKSKK